MKIFLRITFALISVFSVHSLHSQNIPSIAWQQSFGGSINETSNTVYQTFDGGFVVAGYSKSNNGDVSGNHGNQDYWVLKLDTAGNISWQRSLGGSDFDEEWGMNLTADGGYIIAGQSKSNDGDVSGNHGLTDYWIVKLNAEGNIDWQKSLGGSDYDEAYAVSQTTDGGYIVAGNSESADGDVSGNHGDYDFWVVKLDANGNLVWQKSLGGSDEDECYAVQQTSDGGYILAGGTESDDGDVSGNHGDQDVWVVKLDLNGNVLWQKSFGGSSDEEALSLQQTSDGGYIFAGTSASNDGDVSGNHGDYDAWIVKTDAGGNLLWQRSLGGSGYDDLHSIVQLNDGSYVASGYTSSTDDDVSVNHGDEDVWVVKLDISGNLAWSHCYGGSGTDEASSLELVNDSALIISCYSKSNDGDVAGNHGLWDYWILTTDLNGTIQWEKNFGGSLNDVCYAARPTNDNGFILAGYSESNDGDGSGNHGKKDFWAVRLQGVVGVNEIQDELIPLTVYPQPATGFCYIKIPDDVLYAHSNTSLHIYDVEGKQIKTILADGNPLIKLDCSAWSGIYFYKLDDGIQPLYFGKLIIQ